MSEKNAAARCLYLPAARLLPRCIQLSVTPVLHSAPVMLHLNGSSIYKAMYVFVFTLYTAVSDVMQSDLPQILR